MKKTFILFLVLISIISFGQRKEYTEAVNLFNDKKYTESLVIVDKLLNKEFGELTEEQEFYSLQMKINYYNYSKDYKKAYDTALSYLTFVKNSNGLFSDENKIKVIEDAEKFITDIKTKIPSAQMISSNASTNSSTVQNTETKSATDNKTVTLTVSGTGKTLEEAKLNALRSAIEQAFGAFISSKTEILNDNLVKDEIVSVTNGSIQKYDVVSQLEIPNNGYAVTLNATISIEKLTTFAESKGVTVEFKGGMFGLKIKLQKLNEKNELNECINILSVVHELLQVGYDYTLETEEPKFFKDTKYSIKFKVTGKPNSNFYKAIDYLRSSLSNLQMSENEILEYVKMNKKYYKFRGFSLRNELSYKTLKNIESYANYYAGNFNLIINNEKKISGPDLGGSFDRKNMLYNDLFTFPSFMFAKNQYKSTKEFMFEGVGATHRVGNNDVDGEDKYIGNTTIDSNLSFKNSDEENKNSDEKVENKYLGKTTLDPAFFTTVYFEWKQIFDIAEIEKFNSISIIGKGVNSRIKHGGFVIYEDGSRLIIASPYCLSWEGYFSLKKNIKQILTSKKIFEGKSNMDLLKDNQKNNTLYDLVLKYNIENNTDWHIPSEEELKLYIKGVYSTNSRTNVESLLFISSTLRDGYEIFYFDGEKQLPSPQFNNNQKYGVPFNSYDSFELLAPLFSLKDIYYGSFYNLAIPLVKYVTK